MTQPYLLLKKDDKYGVLDALGSIVLPIKYDKIVVRFSKDEIRVVGEKNDRFFNGKGEECETFTCDRSKQNLLKKSVTKLEKLTATKSPNAMFSIIMILCISPIVIFLVFKKIVRTNKE